MNQCL
jgi:hypothetical protein